MIACQRRDESVSSMDSADVGLTSPILISDFALKRAQLIETSIHRPMALPWLVDMRHEMVVP
jgi:hypothetical protein